MSRAARYGAYTLAALALLVVVAVAILPRLLDRPRMAAQIQQKLSSAVKGEVRWEAFRVRLLPTPQGTLRGLSVKTAAATLTTEEATVSLRLWPLFTGNAEITSLTLVRPVLSLTVVPAAAVPEEAQLAPSQGALQTYRSAMSVIVDALREFAPDTVVAVENADLNVHVEGMPPIDVSNLALRARTGRQGVDLDATAASRYWTTMKLAGRIEYADLSSTAELHLTRIQGQAWLDWLLKPTGLGAALPEADLSAKFRGDAAKALELEFDGSAPTLTITRGDQRLAATPLALQAKLVTDDAGAAVYVTQLAVGASSLAGGVLSYSRKEGAFSGDVGYHLDLAQALGYARQLAPEPLARIESVSGALNGRLKPAIGKEDWRIGVSVDQSDAAVQVKQLPDPIRLARAIVEVDPRGARAENVALSLPAGELVVSKASYGLKDGAAAGSVQFDLDVARSLALARGVLPEEKRGALDIVEAAGGHLRGSAKGDWSGKTWSAAAQIAESDAQAKLKPLPAPISLASAALRATPKAVTVERAAVKLLDTSATASATISDFSAPRIQGSVSEATIGPKLLAWVWQNTQLPPNLEPKAPIRLAAPQFAWGPKSALELRADARFDSGPLVTVDLASSPELLEVRHAQLKDGRSDATVSLRMRREAIDGSYSGRLDGRTIAAMLKTPVRRAGVASGKLRFTLDRAEPRRSTVEGELKAESLDLSALAGAPAMLERLELSADGDSLRVAQASVDWAGQRATLRGQMARTPSGPVVDAEIDSPGIVVDALLPKEKPKPAAEKPAGKASSPRAQIWPLPLTGHIALRTKLLQYEHYKVAPLRASVTLERERAVLDVQEALLCGLAVPLTIEAKPGGFVAATQIAAQKQKIEDAAQCLAGENFLVTGPMDLRVDVRSEGQLTELVQNLKGTVSADVRNGTVTKFALLGNILSMQNVAALVTEGPQLGKDAFPFRQLAAKGHFDKGYFYVDEGVFHSNAIGLGANGWISLTDYETRLTVLVAPLALVDEAVRKLPLLGYVVGGTFTSLPVSVRGDIRNPVVVPLGPGAITNEMKGLITRTFSLPGKAIGK
ncbi:MAG TPA: AsmA-like C-terminal domain-containing protein [Burkholderiales bacterium]|nr:AsmA-like C-terminal domain-containing protein [Burkholderiales bacterium]